jgi:hypothetical protein
MMMKQLRARASATAIVAALALPSTMAVAQEATTQVPPAASTPVAVDPAPAVTTTTTTADPLAPVETTTTTKTTTTKIRTAPKARTAAKAPVAPRAPVRTTSASTASAPVAAPVAPVAAPVEPTPIVDATPEPAAAAPAPVAVSEPAVNNDQAILLGAGALALIALAAAAVALARRTRRRHELAEYDMAPVEPVAAPEPEPTPVFEPQPAIIAPPRSAFAWNTQPQIAAAKPGEAHSNETWVERAQRGPTPDNPSLSLRKRMKRAAFFDQREADAAAGKAVAVDPDAGLPDNLDTRELEAA